MKFELFLKNNKITYLLLKFLGDLLNPLPCCSLRFDSGGLLSLQCARKPVRLGFQISNLVLEFLETDVMSLSVLHVYNEARRTGQSFHSRS